MTQISVLLPVHQAAATISRAIDSILAQSFTDFELIIIANGIDRATQAVLEPYDELPNIRIFTLEQPNLVKALNKGIDMARGKYIARMDADDYAYPQRLEKQLAILTEHPDIGVVASLVQHKPQGQDQQGYGLHVDHINGLTSPKDHYMKRFVDAPVAHPSVMFRKVLAEKYGGYKEFDGPEDYELWLRWMAQGVRFFKLNEVLLDWYDYPDRLSRSHQAYKAERFSDLKAQYFAMWWQQTDDRKPLYIWGYGKHVFRKVNFLEENSLTISGYIDVKHKMSTKRRCLHHTDYTKDMGFVLIYVSDRKGKYRIIDYLLSNGAIEGSDFLLMS